MQEEAKISELFGIVRKGKWIIIVLTILTMILSYLYNSIAVKPIYESTSLVVVNTNSLPSGDNKQQLPAITLSPVIEQVKSDVSLSKMISNMNLSKDYSVASLRNSFKITPLPDSPSSLKITTTGSDPSMSTKITNAIALQLGALIEISDRSNLMVDYQNKLNAANEALKEWQFAVEATKTDLANTPQTITTNQKGADVSGNVNFQKEEINPSYTEVKKKLAEITVDKSKFEEQTKNFTAKIEENKKVLNQMQDALENGKITDANSFKVLTSGFKAILVSPALQPDQPVGPNKLLNLVIATVLALMCGIMLVFVRHWLLLSRVQQINVSDK